MKKAPDDFTPVYQTSCSCYTVQGFPYWADGGKSPHPTPPVKNLLIPAPPPPRPPRKIAPQKTVPPPGFYPPPPPPPPNPPPLNNNFKVKTQ